MSDMDTIAAARALIAAQPDLLFRCDLCPDECNCHPHHDMSMSGEYILCDECEDLDNPAGVPDPLKLIATLADAVEAERAKVAAAYEAGQLRMRELCGDMVEREGHGLHVAIRYAPLTPADADAALDKMLAEARLEGWRAGRDDAAEIAVERYKAWIDDDSCPVECDVTACADVAAAIRALPEPKEASNA